jgi:hypothetical protein
MGISFGISDCDLGASPQMTKGSLISKMVQQNQMANEIMKMSPLAVQARYFSLSKNASNQGGAPNGGN